MTGLLSVFSLLPVQALKTKDDNQGQVEEAGSTDVIKQGGGQKMLLEDDESSDRNTERYHCIHTFFFSFLLYACHFIYFVFTLYQVYTALTFRKLLHKVNKNLSQVLVDIIKTTAAAEETLGLHLQRMCDVSAGVQKPQTTTQRETWQTVKTDSIEVSTGK